MYNDNYLNNSNLNHSMLLDMNAFVPGLFVFEEIARGLMNVASSMTERVKQLSKRSTGVNDNQTAKNQVSSFLSAKEIRAMRRSSSPNDGTVGRN